MKVYKVTVDANGNIHWFNEQGQLHREEGPAIENCTGTKKWLINDKYHRLDGPAVEYADGSKEWHINGIWLTEEKFNIVTKAMESCVGKVIELDGKKYKLIWQEIEV